MLSPPLLTAGQLQEGSADSPASPPSCSAWGSGTPRAGPIHGSSQRCWGAKKKRVKVQVQRGRWRHTACPLQPRHSWVRAWPVGDPMVAVALWRPLVSQPVAGSNLRSARPRRCARLGQRPVAEQLQRRGARPVAADAGWEEAGLRGLRSWSPAPNPPGESQSLEPPVGVGCQPELSAAVPTRCPGEGGMSGLGPQEPKPAAAPRAGRAQGSGCPRGCWWWEEGRCGRGLPEQELLCSLPRDFHSSALAPVFLQGLLSLLQQPPHPDAPHRKGAAAAENTTLTWESTCLPPPAPSPQGQGAQPPSTWYP